MWGWIAMLYEGASCEIVISSSYDIQITCVELVVTCVWCKLVWSCPQIMVLISCTPPSFASSKCCSKQAINLPDSGESWCEAKVQRPSTVVKMKSNIDDAAVVILVFQVSQWKLGCWLDLDFLIGDLPHSGWILQDFLPFFLWLEILWSWDLVSSKSDANHRAREKEYTARADLCHVTWFPWK